MGTITALQTGVIFCALLALSMLTGCGNTRFYCGLDDYGDAQQMHHEFITQGKKGVAKYEK